MPGSCRRLKAAVAEGVTAPIRKSHMTVRERWSTSFSKEQRFVLEPFRNWKVHRRGHSFCDGACRRGDRMRRRDVIGLFAALAWQGAPAFARNSHKWSLIGFLSPGAQQFTMYHTAPAFLQGMRDLGYVEGRDFDVAYRFSEGYQDRLPALAEELVQLRPHVILASAVVAAAAARQATSSIPIVCPALADAVHLGLVVSEARARARNRTRCELDRAAHQHEGSQGAASDAGTGGAGVESQDAFR